MLTAGLLLAGCLFTASAQTITTVAGNGPEGNYSDEVPAISSRLYTVYGLAVDGQGDLYISDGGRIRKVTSDGIIHAFAGDGWTGFQGDGGPAIKARFANTHGIAVDAQGSLLIGDQVFNNRIRKVTPDGIINTIVGNGLICGGPGSQGCFTGDGGPAINTSLYRPISVALDSQGNLFIADQGNSRIRKVTLQGIITTVAGNGTYGFSGDGGPATSASLNLPISIAVDRQDNVLVVDYGNHRIRKITPDGVITTVAGNGQIGFNGD
ncbi:NHL domain-containing protein [Larkinella arboricola]|uniref:NHL domain-containing protein n=1 Tax=Larkinella arboricola TaxID=643671 RepID=UPI000DB9806D|nr:hypothetical protein [Larkinella arboricola]